MSPKHERVRAVVIFAMVTASAVGILPYAEGVSGVERAVWVQEEVTKRKNTPASHDAEKAQRELQRAKASGVAAFPLVLTFVDTGSSSPPTMAKVVTTRVVLGVVPLLALLVFLWWWLKQTRVLAHERLLAMVLAAFASPLLVYGGLATGAMWATLATTVAAWLLLTRFCRGGFEDTLGSARFEELPTVLLATFALIGAIGWAPAVWPAAVVIAAVPLFRARQVAHRLLPVLLVGTAVLASDALLSAPGFLFRRWPSWDAASAVVFGLTPIWCWVVLTRRRANRALARTTLFLFFAAFLADMSLAATYAAPAALLPVVPLASVVAAQTIGKARGHLIWGALALYSFATMWVATCVWPFVVPGVKSPLIHVAVALLRDGWWPPSLASAAALPTSLLAWSVAAVVVVFLIGPLWWRGLLESSAHRTFAAVVGAMLIFGGTWALAKGGAAANRFRRKHEATIALDQRVQPVFLEVPRGPVAKKMLAIVEASEGRVADKAGKETACPLETKKVLSLKCPRMGSRVRFSVETFRFFKKPHVALRLPTPRGGGDFSLRSKAGVWTGWKAFHFAVPDKNWRKGRGQPITIELKVGGRPAHKGTIDPDGLHIVLDKPVTDGETVTITGRNGGDSHVPFLLGN